LRQFKTYCTLIVLLVCQVIYSQEIKPGKPNELDKIYSPDKTSSKPILNSSSSFVADKSNFLKFNFGLLARGTFALHYERKLNDVISILGGLGHNYKKDKIQAASATEDFFMIDNSTSSVSLNQILANGVYAKGANLFASGSIKFSYDGIYSAWNYDDERRSFIQLECRYSGVNMNLYDIQMYDTQISNGNNLMIKNTCYLISWGYQFTAGSKLPTSHEFLVGFGVRKVNYNVFNSEQSYNQYGQSIIIHKKTMGTETLSAPMLTLGYILGFGF
jgi:hypothetical protein